jgi:hypothetical protein
MLKAIYSWKRMSRRPIRRPKTRWVDDVRKGIQKLKVPNWKTLAQDRRWKELIEKAKTLLKITVEPHKKIIINYSFIHVITRYFCAILHKIGFSEQISIDI